MMKILSYDSIVDTVARLVTDTNYFLPDDVLAGLVQLRDKETSLLAVSILDQIVENARIASEEKLPLCQDTGVAVFIVEIGEDVRIGGAGLDAAINDGVRKGYREGGLRMSIVGDSLDRANTHDNTPAIIHCSLIPGDKLIITFFPKGGGCENMSRISMLSPGQGLDGVRDFIIDTIRIGGGRPCPPVIVGVGIGGNFESSALLSKRSLMRKVGERNSSAFYAGLEEELLETINGLGIGPMGLGGRSTAIDVFIETAPCHIASLPVAVNIQCHSARRGTVVM